MGVEVKVKWVDQMLGRVQGRAESTCSGYIPMARLVQLNLGT